MQVTNINDKQFKKKSFKPTLSHSLVVFLGFSFFYILFFSPILFSDRLLAQPADGIAYFLPAFYSARNLWTELIFAGYPIAADPQNMTWYPPGLLLRLIPQSWNAFVVMAYVLASSFAYCYTYTVTSSRLAATVTGLIYGLSGFMIAYLPMAAMIHADAWIPLIVCALEKIRHRFEPEWLAIGAFAIACCFLGGHPQISVYGIGLGFFYALFLGWSAPIGRWKYYRRVSASFILGISLCALQLLPTIELSRLSVRAEMSYEVFLNGSLPSWQGLQLLLPFLFGNGWARTPLNSPYWGKWDFLTTAGYVGLLSLLLAVIGAIAYRKRSIARFWFWAGLITLILVFGEDLWLGKMLYYVPIYNLFRVPARHFIEFALAISVLAGLGISSIQQRWAGDGLIRRTIISGLILMVVSLLGMNIVYIYNDFQAKASLVGITQLHLLPWNNPAIGIPCLVFVFGAIALFTWSRWPDSRWISASLLIILLLDLCSFGFWFRDWKIASLAPSAKKLEAPLAIKPYKTLLQNEHQRFLAVQGIGKVGEIPWHDNTVYPNLTRLWELPNAGGYSPLILSRVSEMMKMEYTGFLNHIPMTVSEHQLDLMGVRYLLAPPSDKIESTRWKKVEQIDSGIIYENQQALPRVWLVSETILLSPGDILAAIHTSQLPDGRTYAPEKMALVEEDAASLKTLALNPTDTAKVLKLTDTQVELQAKTSASAFLVLSDVFYPGWKATIDGKSTEIFPTNYVQRGVKVPPGEHIVRFEFHPLSFNIGVGITTASFFGCSYWLFRKKYINLSLD